MGLNKELERMQRNSIVLKIGRSEKYKLCGTRFGGKPDLPPGFEWPYFEGVNCENIVRKRPLSFLAQFNCEELAQYDTEHLLPDHGLLSFFYETDTQCWGFDPKDKGCARVFWFEDLSVLKAASFPEDAGEDFEFPMTKIKMSQKSSFPSVQDLAEIVPNIEDELDNDNDEEDDELESCSKLLGWADIIQNSMAAQCDLVSQGYYLGGGNDWRRVPKDIRKRAEESALDRWTLLLQLDTVENGDFELMFGDCGRIYFYITKEDLLAHNFDKVWLVLQCY